MPMMMIVVVVILTSWLLLMILCRMSRPSEDPSPGSAWRDPGHQRQL
jgi:hypothetical protein